MDMSSLAEPQPGSMFKQTNKQVMIWAALNFEEKLTNSFQVL